LRKNPDAWKIRLKEACEERPGVLKIGRVLSFFSLVEKRRKKPPADKTPKEEAQAGGKNPTKLADWP